MVNYVGGQSSEMALPLHGPQLPTRSIPCILQALVPVVEGFAIRLHGSSDDPVSYFSRIEPYYSRTWL